MSKRFEPDTQFVDRLEWQLASEFRRREHLKPAPGRIAVPRSVAVLSLVAGVLLLGVAATKAADLIKDSWRKKIEVARLETEVKIKTALLDLKKDMAAQAETRFSLGLISEEEALDSKRTVARAASELEKARLDLEEVRGSGDAPRDELYAPLVGGRDFVSERLEIRKKALEADLDLRKGSASNGNSRSGSAWASFRRARWIEFKMSMRVRAGEGIEDIENGPGAARRKYASGEISAEELEIQARMAEAEKELREARTWIGNPEAGSRTAPGPGSRGPGLPGGGQGSALQLGVRSGQGRAGPPRDRDPEDDQIAALRRF